MPYILKGWDFLVDTSLMTREEIKDLINRRRRQILVHSIIYYRLNENLIDDATWSGWGLELEKLQERYPDISAECVYADAFKDFDHSTGMSLPLDDPWGRRTAQYLVQISHKKQRPL